jgi:hypothetical protein
MPFDKNEYTSYIDQHRANVKKVWEDVKDKVLTHKNILLGDSNIARLEDNIIKHDMSKYGPEEFEGYGENFFGKDGTDIANAEEMFDIAWNHHQKHNPHHWEYWMLIDDNKVIVLDMPIEYIIEMLCDWTAMSYKFGDTPSEFFNHRQHHISRTDFTSEVIQDLLPIFDKAAEKHRLEKNKS